MEEAVLRFFLNIPLNVTISCVCVTSFLFNYFILKAKKEYKGFHKGIFFILLLPYFNLIFLFTNVLIGMVNLNGCKIVRVNKKGKSTKKGVPAPAKA